MPNRIKYIRAPGLSKTPIGEERGILLTMDSNSNVTRDGAAITGSEITTLADNGNAVFLWDEYYMRLYHYGEEDSATYAAVFVAPNPSGNGCYTATIAANASMAVSAQKSITLPASVLYTSQTLTDAQKEQARENIGAYRKPSGGIPASDLASVVQSSLGKADTALQSPDLSSAIDSALAQAKASGEFDGADGHSPFINTSGYWVFWNYQTNTWRVSNLKAEGTPGADGHSPYIGQNGNWFAWDDNLAMYDDTGIEAQGADGARGPSAIVQAYLDDGVVRIAEAYESYTADDIYTSLMMQTDIDNGVMPLVSYSPVDGDSVYFELDAHHSSAASPIIYFRSKDYLLSVDSTGAYTLTNRPQGGGSSDAVLYNTTQMLTDAQKEQARGNIGAVSASDIPQNVRLDVVQMTTSDIQPLFVDVLAGNWLGSQNAAYSNGAENAEKYFTFSGASGSNSVSVTGGTASISALTTNQWWRGVVEYDDGHCVPTMVSYQGTADTLGIYPPLDSAVTSGKIMPIMFSIHATSLGYKWYSQYVYGVNAKYCVKSKPIARFCAWKGDTNPLTKINTFWWGENTGNVQRTLQVTNPTLKYIHMNIAKTASAETPKGFSWTVPVNGKTGYVEIDMSGLQNATFFDYPSGEGFFAEIYQDGVLTDTYHKTTVHYEPICLDFSGCQSVEIRVYTVGNTVDNSIELSEVSVWETGDYRSELLPFGSIPAQMFDSWGVQFDGATATEFKRMHSAKLGVTAPWENHSLGGATSAWGRAWFYENVVKYHPTHMLIDFIINDSNSRGASGFAQTVAGPDGTLYDNVMDTVDEYIANMNAIIRMAIAAGIQPIICMAPYGENEKPDWSRKLIDAWSSQGA